MKKEAKVIQKSKKPNLIIKILEHHQFRLWGIPFLTLFFSFIVGAFIFLLLGISPTTAYKSFLQGAGLLGKAKYGGSSSQLSDFLSFLNFLTPMIFAALSVAVALKAGLFNIGVAGQMLIAGFAATVIVGYQNWPPWIAKPLVIFIGILVGGMIGWLVGFLKYRFNINEVVSTIMINYIVRYVVAFFIFSYFIDPVSRQSKNISSSARLTLMGVKSLGGINFGGAKVDIPLAIVLALLSAVFIKFFLDRTAKGFEIKMIGANFQAASYAGVNVGATLRQSMFISGALAGMAGVTYYLGYFGSIQPDVLPGMGFDSIAVALLGNAHPIGIVFSSFLISIVEKGSTYLTSSTGTKREIAALITGIILLFSACSEFFRYLNSRFVTYLKSQNLASKEK